MDIVAKILYWASLLVILYTYLGYGLLMAIWAKWRGQRPGAAEAPGAVPMVTIVIPAFNEAGVLGAKIRNTLELNYPAHMFEVMEVKIL